MFVKQRRNTVAVTPWKSVLVDHDVPGGELGDRQQLLEQLAGWDRGCLRPKDFGLGRRKADR